MPWNKLNQGCKRLYNGNFKRPKEENEEKKTKMESLLCL